MAEKDEGAGKLPSDPEELEGAPSSPEQEPGDLETATSDQTSSSDDSPMESASASSPDTEAMEISSGSNPTTSASKKKGIGSSSVSSPDVEMADSGISSGNEGANAKGKKVKFSTGNISDSASGTEGRTAAAGNVTEGASAQDGESIGLSSSAAVRVNLAVSPPGYSTEEAGPCLPSEHKSSAEKSQSPGDSTEQANPSGATGDGSLTTMTFSLGFSAEQTDPSDFSSDSTAQNSSTERICSSGSSDEKAGPSGFSSGDIEQVNSPESSTSLSSLELSIHPSFPAGVEFFPTDASSVSSEEQVVPTAENISRNASPSQSYSSAMSEGVEQQIQFPSESNVALSHPGGATSMASGSDEHNCSVLTELNNPVMGPNSPTVEEAELSQMLEYLALYYNDDNIQMQPGGGTSRTDFNQNDQLPLNRPSRSSDPPLVSPMRASEGTGCEPRIPELRIGEVRDLAAAAISSVEGAPTIAEADLAGVGPFARAEGIRQFEMDSNEPAQHLSNIGRLDESNSGLLGLPRKSSGALDNEHQAAANASAAGLNLPVQGSKMSTFERVVKFGSFPKSCSQEAIRGPQYEIEHRTSDPRSLPEASGGTPEDFPTFTPADLAEMRQFGDAERRRQDSRANDDRREQPLEYISSGSFEEALLEARNQDYHPQEVGDAVVPDVINQHPPYANYPPQRHNANDDSPYDTEEHSSDSRSDATDLTDEQSHQSLNLASPSVEPPAVAEEEVQQRPPEREAEEKVETSNDVQQPVETQRVDASAEVDRQIREGTQTVLAGVQTNKPSEPVEAQQSDECEKTDDILHQQPNETQLRSEQRLQQLTESEVGSGSVTRLNAPTQTLHQGEATAVGFEENSQKLAPGGSTSILSQDDLPCSPGKKVATGHRDSPRRNLWPDKASGESKGAKISFSPGKKVAPGHRDSPRRNLLPDKASSESPFSPEKKMAIGHRNSPKRKPEAYGESPFSPEKKQATGHLDSPKRNLGSEEASGVSGDNLPFSPVKNEATGHRDSPKRNLETDEASGQSRGDNLPFSPVKKQATGHLDSPKRNLGSEEASGVSGGADLSSSPVKEKGTEELNSPEETKDPETSPKRTSSNRTSPKKEEEK